MPGGTTKKIPRLGRRHFELAVDFLAHPEKYSKRGPQDRDHMLSNLLGKLADEKILRAQDGFFSRFTEIRGYARKPLDATELSFELVLDGQQHTISYGSYYNLVTLEEIGEDTELPPPNWVEPDWLVALPPPKKKGGWKPTPAQRIVSQTRVTPFPEGILPSAKPFARRGSRFGTRSANE